MRDQLRTIQAFLALAAISVAMLAGVLPHHHDSLEVHGDECALCILGQQSSGERAEIPPAGPAPAETGRFDLFDPVIPERSAAAQIDARGPPLC